MMTRENPITRSIKETVMLGLTQGTRHYIQYQLTDGEKWTDLLFQNADGQIQGLWCSRSYSAANARIEELMAECNTDRSQYRIVKRTWQEDVIEHIAPAAQSDGDEDEDEDEDATMEADLESQVGEVPDTGDEPTEVINPLEK